MRKTLCRLVFSLSILGTPLMLVGCAEGEKPATTPPATTEATTAPAPPEGGPPPATTPPAEPAK
jgi:hypothetical protein